MQSAVSESKMRYTISESESVRESVGKEEMMMVDLMSVRHVS